MSRDRYSSRDDHVRGVHVPLLDHLGVGPHGARRGPIGGWMAAGFIVGSVWMINHVLPGVGFGTEMTTASGLIWQSGDAWIDMAWAAGIGLWIGSTVRGASLGRSLPTLIAAVLGGIFGGVILGFIGR